MFSASYLIKGFAACAIIVSAGTISFSQNSTIDSLNKIIASSENDSIKSIALIELASNYYGYDTLKTDQALEKAFSILKDKKWDFNLGYYYQAKSAIVFYQGAHQLSLDLDDSAIYFYKKALHSKNPATRTEASFQYAVTTADKGVSYATMGSNEEGLKHYLEALRLYEASGHPARFEKIGTTYNNISAIYYGLQEFEKALEYDLKAIPFLLKGGNTESIAFAYIFTSGAFSMLERYDSARVYFDKALPYVKALNKPSVNIEYYGKTGALYRKIKDWKNAAIHYTVAFDEAKKINDVFNQAALSRQIAAAYFFQDKYKEAEDFGIRSLEISEKNNFVKEKIFLYELLSKIYDKKGDAGKAYLFLRKYVDITDSTKQEELKKKVTELEAKYQSEKKEKDILQLQKEKEAQQFSLKQKSVLNFVLVGSLVAAIAIAGLLLLSYKRKQQLAGQRIRELETEKKLSATEAILKGQEEERGRLAKDLHDGLGGMLSGVKYSLSNMKENLIVTPENMTVFERSLDLIDSSIKELRRVAHNMMPEMLVKFGLDEALKDYCNMINATQIITVKYQSFGLETRLDASTEITVYRIIQELLNNILKHASASEAFVQVLREDSRLNIIVEDNGKGFDVSKMGNKGAGWTSVQSRVDYLKGKIELNSQEGKGTTVNMEFNLSA